MKFMQAVGVYAHIHRAYKSGGQFQWAREGLVNSIQAQATEINFGVEWQAVAKNKGYRRTIIDNGHGISAPLMPAFLNKFGGSGRAIGDTFGNFGLGLKTSVLPWNRKGVVVLSVSAAPDNALSRVNMMWLQLDTRADGSADYGARELVTDYFDQPTEESDELVTEWMMSFGKNEDANTVLPLSLLKKAGYDTVVDGIDWFEVVPKWMLVEGGHGTVIVLLGNKENEHTIMGDPAREEGADKYGLVRYLNTRFFTLPENVTVTVTSLGAEIEGKKLGWGNPARWAKTPESAGISNRVVVGMREALEKYGHMVEKKELGHMQYGQVKLNGGATPVSVLVDTYLYPESKPSPGSTGADNTYLSGVLPALPIIAYKRKCHEDIDVVETFDARTQAEGKQALLPWVNLDPIRRRLVIILEPLDEDDGDVKVFSDQSRRTLLYQNKTKGGTDLPEAEWAEEFKKHRPDFLTKAIESYFASLSSDDAVIDKDYVEKLNQFLPFMNVTIMELRNSKKRKRKRNENDPVDDVEEEEEEKSGPKPHGPHNPPNHPKDGVDDEDDHTIQRSKRGLIEVKEGEAEPPFPIVLNTDSNPPVGIVNVTHPLIQDAWKQCQLKLQEQAVSESQMDAYMMAFKAQVRAHVTLALTHLWGYLKANNWQNKEQLLSPAGLTSIAAGLRHFYQAAQGPFGNIKSGRVRRSAKPA